MVVIKFVFSTVVIPNSQKEVLYWNLKYEYKCMASKYIDMEINVNLRTQTYIPSCLLRVTKSNDIPVAMDWVFTYHAPLERERVPWRIG